MGEIVSGTLYRRVAEFNEYKPEKNFWPTGLNGHRIDRDKNGQPIASTISVECSSEYTANVMYDIFERLFDKVAIN